MKNLFQPKISWAALLMLSLFVFSCASEEEVFENELVVLEEEDAAPESDDLTAAACSGGNQSYTYSGDVNSAVNSTIDDRSCAYNYTQTSNGTSHTWGVYRLKANNSTDGLQTRIERASKVVSNVKGGNYVQISGTCRIKKVGGRPSNNNYPYHDIRDKRGTYILQAKGKHSGGGGSSDPAICLFVAKKRVDNGVTYYYIYREQIVYRGGSGLGGRVLKYITKVRENTDFNVTVKTGFWGNPVNQHYVNATINGVTANWNVPEPDRALQAKLRMGAYRCHEGEAEILWRDNLAVSFKNSN